MKVVFIKYVAKVGNVGDVCEVKDGYAKNYLLPNGLAVAYGDVRAQKILEQVKNLEKKKREESDSLSEKVSKIVSQKIEIKAKMNAKNQLFASVKQDEIKKIVKEKFGIVPEKVEGVPLKSLGVFEVVLEFGGGKKALIEVIISGL